MMGNWPTVELRPAFIASGTLLYLMDSLYNLIVMREVVYLKVPKPTPAQDNISSGKIYTAFFHAPGPIIMGLKALRRTCLRNQVL